MRTITYGRLSNTGKVRSENQDCLGKFPEGTDALSVSKGQLFVVADGMGGHAGGQLASDIAVRTLGVAYASASTEDIRESLLQAFQKANEEILAHARAYPQYTGMGTTCTALVLQNTNAVIAHIGDTRVYRIGRNRITQLTDDHSKVAEMIRRNIITKEEAKRHPERSHLYRALGIRPAVEVDIIDRVPIRPPVTFLMCTDGLYNHVDDDEMRRIVGVLPPDEAVNELVNLANDRGGLDNISVQIIRVNPSESRLQRLFKRKRKR
jgi:PPM family protein phosphatase